MHALCSVILDSSDSNSHAYVTIWSQRNLGLCLHTIHYEWMLTMLTYFKINLVEVTIHTIDVEKIQVDKLTWFRICILKK